MINKLVISPILAMAVTVFALFAQGVSAQNLPDLVVNYPELIVHNANIITVDDQAYNSNPGTIAQAMAVRDGKILKLGSNADVLALKGPNTKVMDLVEQ